MKDIIELEDTLADFVKEGLSGKVSSGDKSVIESFKKALDTTTPELPGDPRDAKDKAKKKPDMEWW